MMGSKTEAEKLSKAASNSQNYLTDSLEAEELETQNSLEETLAPPCPKVPVHQENDRRRAGVRPSISKRKRYKGWEGGGLGKYMKVKVEKLRDQFANDYRETSDEKGAELESKDRSLFRGVTIWVDGATRPNRDELRDIVGSQGGRFETYLTGAVTHVICTRLAQATKLRLRKMVHSKRVHVVRPEWVEEAVRTRKLPSVAKFSVDGMAEKGQKSITAFF